MRDFKNEPILLTVKLKVAWKLLAQGLIISLIGAAMCIYLAFFSYGPTEIRGIADLDPEQAKVFYTCASIFWVAMVLYMLTAAYRQLCMGPLAIVGENAIRVSTGPLGLRRPWIPYNQITELQESYVGSQRAIGLRTANTTVIFRSRYFRSEAIFDEFVGLLFGKCRNLQVPSEGKL